MSRIYPGYVVDIAKRELVYNPIDPSAEWCLVINQRHYSNRLASALPYTLIRQLDGGGWEVIYNNKFKPTINMIIRSIVWEAEIKLEEYKGDQYGNIRDLLRNEPSPLRNTSVRSSPANKLCCKCGKGSAVGLVSYSNSSASRIVRHFCRDCLTTGEPVDERYSDNQKKDRICHVCRSGYRAGKSAKFYAETRGANLYEFRIHPSCVKDLDNYLPKPIEERRPLRQMVITPAEVAKYISNILPDWLKNTLSAEILGEILGGGS